jgi:hypothetical protein
MDGDGTYPPDSVPLLLYVMMEEKVDFITARRWYSKSGEVKSPVRLLGNAILSGTMMSLYFRFIIDSQSGMWMFKKDILPELDLTSNGMALSEEIKIEAFTHPGIRASRCRSTTAPASASRSSTSGATASTTCSSW